MTKQEKIQEIYGSRYIALKDSINCDGWINQNVTTRALFDSLEFDEKRNSMRPLELKGIENNNGWTKVESDEELPNESTLYWVQQSDGRIQTIKEYFDNKQYYNITATGYQRIEYPKKQIY